MRRVALAVTLIVGALAFAPAAHASALEDWVVSLFGFGYGGGSSRISPARMSCGDGDGVC